MKLDEISKPKQYAVTEEMIKMVPKAAKYYNQYFETFDAPVIYRGMKSDLMTGEVRLVNPKAVGRVSRNTSNEYTILCSNLKSWANYPRRDQSIIMSLSHFIAGSYGSLAGVILPNKMNLGICPETDFWESFPWMESKLDSTVGSMDSFNTALNWIFEYAEKQGYPMYRKAKTMSELMSNFRQIDRSIKAGTLLNNKSDAYGKVRVGAFMKGAALAKLPMAKFVEYILDPVKNGFQVMHTVKELLTFNAGVGLEVWTDSTCLMIKPSDYPSFRHLVLTYNRQRAAKKAPQKP